MRFDGVLMAVTGSGRSLGPWEGGRREGLREARLRVACCVFVCWGTGLGVGDIVNWG